MPHKHINREDRKTIAALLNGGRHNHSEIAAQIGKTPSAVCREIMMNADSDGRYLAGSADAASRERRGAANALRAKLYPGSNAEKELETGLRKFWSPEQIAGRQVRELGSALVSPAAAYVYIHKERRDLIPLLRHGKKRLHRRRHGTKLREEKREEAKKNRIADRPRVVDNRSRIGDWEGDTVVGQEKTEHILTHVERKSGYLLGDRVSGVASSVRVVTERRFGRHPKKKICTITYDNGIQFSEHETLARNLGVDIYFANPYHSWERGTNENTNGLLRQFVPKGTYFASITQRRLDRYVKLINTRPRKRLGYRTPEEVFNCVSD